MSRQQKNSLQSNRRNKTQKTIRRWHRWVGYISFFFVLILSLTGLILNRTEKLGLNQIMVNNDFVSSLYGLSPNSPPQHFKVKEHLMSWLEGRVYLDGDLITQNSPPLVGGAILDGLIIVGTENRLSLFMDDGTLVEVMDSSSLPGKITSINQSEKQGVLILTPNGTYATFDDFISWDKQSVSSPLVPKQEIQAPDHITEKIMHDFKGQGISLSRVILDLHSGHIMGSFGPYIMDLAAISLIFLGLTGLMKRRRSDKRKSKK
ncbi:MAG: PepSY domain-containing protein [Emcibacter sp.]|nr:PepSY domain-containing protein [Emcibacter sp.]